MSKDILSGLEYTFAIIDELAFKESEKMERKFKVGDEVKIIKVTPALIGSERAKEYIGKKGKVTEVYGSHYLLDLDEGKFKWYEDELELVKFTPKSLLKDGVVATFRDGYRAILHDGDFIYKGKRGNHHIYSRVINYDDNLNAVADIDVMEYDIMKLEFDGKVIWERPLIDYDTLLDNIHEYLNTTTEVDGKVDYLKIKQLIADFEKEWGLE